MTTPTIVSVGTDANSLYTALASDLDIDLNLPPLAVDTDFAIPAETGPAYDPVPKIELADLTTQVVGGTGVFDALMTTMSAHLAQQFEKGRITGGDYANVYLGALQAVQQFAVQFLLGKDKAYWENLQAQANFKLAQAQIVRANADVQIARMTIRQMQYTTAETELKAYTARNQYALSKMQLVTGYNEILSSDAQIKLVTEQFEIARAQTRDTLSDGTPVHGIVGTEKALSEAKVETAKEELDLARSQTKDTLLDGTTVAGLAAVTKAVAEANLIKIEAEAQLIGENYEAARAQTRETMSSGDAIEGLLGLEKELKASQMKTAAEQYEIARAQIRDTLSTGGAFAGMVAIDKLMKEAQKDLTIEQLDTQRAQTKDTLSTGGPIVGIAAKEKALKDAQSKLVLEQYESQRGQTRGSLSTGEIVGGMLGAQTALYNQQVTSYKRDSESKALKLLLDTWTARKAIDEGVPVPTQIDTAAIDTSLSKYRANLSLT